MPGKSNKSKGIEIIGGRVIDPSQDIDRPATVLIKNDKIEEITATPLAEAPEDYDVIDAADQVVTPGFIDVHTQLREPGEEHKETIETGTMAAARGGFTTVCAMPNTDPCQDNANVIAAVMKLASEFAAVRVLPIGAVTVGRHGKRLSNSAALAQAGGIGCSGGGDARWEPNSMRQAGV